MTEFNENLKKTKEKKKTPKKQMDNWIKCENCKMWKKVSIKFLQKNKSNQFFCLSINGKRCIKKQRVVKPYKCLRRVKKIFRTSKKQANK